jgi:hypothetical protein
MNKMPKNKGCPPKDTGCSKILVSTNPAYTMAETVRNRKLFIGVFDLKVKGLQAVELV